MSADIGQPATGNSCWGQASEGSNSSAAEVQTGNLQRPKSDREALQETSSVFLDEGIENPRAASVISISSSSDSEASTIVKPFSKTRRPISRTPVPARARIGPDPLEIIDLCGEEDDDDSVLGPPDDREGGISTLEDDDSVFGSRNDDDSVLGGSEGRDVEETPEMLGSSHLPPGIKGDAVDQNHQERAKRKLDQMSAGGDADLIESNGNGWRRASWRRSHPK
jgi:hypothetical protein